MCVLSTELTSDLWPVPLLSVYDICSINDTQQLTPGYIKRCPYIKSYLHDWPTRYPTVSSIWPFSEVYDSIVI